MCCRPKQWAFRKHIKKTGANWTLAGAILFLLQVHPTKGHEFAAKPSSYRGVRGKLGTAPRQIPTDTSMAQLSASLVHEDPGGLEPVAWEVGVGVGWNVCSLFVLQFVALVVRSADSCVFIPLHRVHLDVPAYPPAFAMCHACTQTSNYKLPWKNTKTQSDTMPTAWKDTKTQPQQQQSSIQQWPSSINFSQVGLNASPSHQSCACRPAM